MTLARDLKSGEILVDWNHARFAAEIMGLIPRETIYILLKALRKGILNLDDYLKDLETLVKSGFRMNDDIYIEAIRLGKKLSEEEKRD